MLRVANRLEPPQPIANPQSPIPAKLTPHSLHPAGT